VSPVRYGAVGVTYFWLRVTKDLICETLLVLTSRGVSARLEFTIWPNATSVPYCYFLLDAALPGMYYHWACLPLVCTRLHDATTPWLSCSQPWPWFYLAFNSCGRCLLTRQRCRFRTCNVAFTGLRLPTTNAHGAYNQLYHHEHSALTVKRMVGTATPTAGHQ